MASIIKSDGLLREIAYLRAMATHCIAVSVSGATTHIHKYEALIWALLLEVAHGDPSECLKCYCDQVICVCTDQGTESLLAKAPAAPASKLLKGIASALDTEVARPGLGLSGTLELMDELGGEVTGQPAALEGGEIGVVLAAVCQCRVGIRIASSQIPQTPARSHSL